MSFFKRLSRGSRSNSASYADDGYDYDSPKSVDKHERFEPRPESSSRQPDQQHNKHSSHSQQSNHTLPPAPPQAPAASKSLDQGIDAQDMYSRSHAAPKDGYQDNYSHSTPRLYANGMSHNALPMMDNSAAQAKSEPMPDLLTQAFQQAVQPYSHKIEQLETQVADMQAYVDQLEQERTEVHAWIDKRGLRPDVPLSIAKAMDTSSDAAVTLNAQLDRKITIVNFDLHRLQDDLNDSISSSHFASAMAKFLPDIQRLAALPGGPRLAFDLILKLGGNLNSHGGLDTADPSDLQARKDFYGQLDNSMVDVVRRRFAEGEEWAVGREIKRIEKTAAYLRNFGVEPYFPHTLEAMNRGQAGEMGHASSSGGMNGGGPVQRPSGSTPPRYQ
ncbi:hypothetical protein K402DRAFT_47211 [Aulographum hederae CBS 113979]|uniref:Uncharacterized protein n=1 Tax=Aulographum hederae CBS 113979 TaxID=1176131 RepID=A0A6G1H2D5_9PEZI|nr:hypothetical protein K402DRAFT_47211 [Aulographum hederae CBS 113979]